MSNAARRKEHAARYADVALRVRIGLTALSDGPHGREPEIRRAVQLLHAAEGRAKLGDLGEATRQLDRLRESLPGSPAPNEAQLERSRAEVARTLAEAGFSEVYAIGETATKSSEFREASRSFTAGEVAARSSLYQDAHRSFESARESLERLLARHGARAEQRLQKIRTRRMQLVQRLRRLPLVDFSASQRDAAFAAIRACDQAIDACDDTQAVAALDECEGFLREAPRMGPPPETPPLRPRQPGRGLSWGMAAIAAIGLAFILAGLGQLDPAFDRARGLFEGHAAPKPDDGRPAARRLPVRPEALPEPASAIWVEGSRAVPAEILSQIELQVRDQALAESSRAAPLPEVRFVRPADSLLHIPTGTAHAFSLRLGSDEPIRWEVDAIPAGIGRDFLLAGAATARPGTRWLTARLGTNREAPLIRAWKLEIHPPLRFERLAPEAAEIRSAVGQPLAFVAVVDAGIEELPRQEWTVDGEVVDGSLGSRFWMAPDRPGDRIVAVRALAPWGETIEHEWTVRVSDGTASVVAERQAAARNWLESMCRAEELGDVESLVRLGEVSADDTRSTRRGPGSRNALRLDCAIRSLSVSEGAIAITFDRSVRWYDERGIRRESRRKGEERMLVRDTSLGWRRAGGPELASR